jgi:hypothetical protein
MHGPYQAAIDAGCIPSPPAEFTDEPIYPPTIEAAQALLNENGMTEVRVVEVDSDSPGIYLVMIPTDMEDELQANRFVGRENWDFFSFEITLP